MAPGRRFGPSTVPLATLPALEGSLADPFGLPKAPLGTLSDPFGLFLDPMRRSLRPRGNVRETSRDLFLWPAPPQGKGGDATWRLIN